MLLSLPIGSTSKIIQIPIFDSSSTTGALLTGLVFNTASLTAYYNREGAAGAAVAIVLATATKGTWATGGFVAVDGTNTPGWYELHIPDLALASGAKSVVVHLKGAANMVPVPILIELTETSNQDAVRGGMTALPASGTLAVNPILNATQTGVTIPTVTTLTGHTAQTGDNFARLGAPAGASVSADVAAVKAETVTILGDTNDIQTRIPAALVGGRIDASVGAVATNAITAASIATDAVVKLRVLVSGTADSGTTTSLVDTERTEVDVDYWRNQMIVFTSGTLLGQARLITAFNPTTDAITFSPATTVAVGTHTYEIRAASDAILAQLTHTGAVVPTVSAITGLTAANLDVAVSTRMATYTQPAGFLAATFPAGTVANTTNITAAAGIVLSGVTHTGAVIPSVTAVTGAVGSVTAGVTVAVGGIPSGGHAAAELNAIADSVLDRNMATGTDSGTNSTAVRTPRQALFALRNKVSVAAGVATITKTDDITTSWSSAIVTTAGNPVSSSDPT